MPAKLPPEERARRKAEQMRRWRDANRERVRADKRLFYRRHREKLLAAMKDKMRDPEEKRKRRERYLLWVAKPENKARVRAIYDRWTKQNPERTLEMSKSYRVRHSEKVSKRAREKRERQKADPILHAKIIAKARLNNATPKAKAAKAAWYTANKAHVVTHVRIRRRTDPAFRLKGTVRTRVWGVLRGLIKAAPTFALVGCTIEELRAHLEAQFKPGMTWENYGRGGWHCDHKRPLCAYDLSDPEQQRAACHFSNLQPLWEAENLSKGGRF